MKSDPAPLCVLVIIICLTLLVTVYPAAAQVRGTIAVSSEPEGASIFLNDEDLGLQTNTFIEDVFPGIHYIRLELPGYRTWETFFEVDEGKVTYISHEMEPIVGGPFSVATTPPGAAVYIDGTFMGTSDTVLYDLPAGQHRILLTLDGYADYAATITIPEDMAQSLVHTFEPPSSTGRITVSSAPTNAAIYLGGVYQGTTPLTLDEVQPGTYPIVLTRTGYENWTGSVEVAAGRISEISAVLVRSPVLLAVASIPPGAEVFVDGTLRGTTPLSISIEQGMHTVRIEKFGYEPQEETVDAGPDGVSVSVPLVSTVPQALDAAEEAIRQNEAYGPDRAVAAIKSAYLQYEVGDAEGAVRYAADAVALAEDVDRDGVTNARDISPRLHNAVIYVLPVLLCILAAALFVRDVALHRVLPVLGVDLPATVREDDMLARAGITADAAGGPYRGFVCTVTIDGATVEHFTIPGRYRVMLGGRGRGVHRLRVHLQVVQERYGTVERSEEWSFIVEPAERAAGGGGEIIDAEEPVGDLAALYEEERDDGGTKAEAGT
ncbi:PEGA domain-containing protein [Methanogenium organophilum]|uniref:PEGA domain-containing protein n=1 Tax=Methanogenium organophilum TaxID=2199 RepID=A0A9X9S6V2_METOG|nr:PEGA domain-containing protein [Methanogenium organophilum]WAI02490.1 PEGA domain-containing protein [Methanogenium organophilum]